MQREALNLTEEDGYEALKAHVVERAFNARERHGPSFNEARIRALLKDPEVVRFPTELAFDADVLLAGEFGWARPKGERPADGFTLVIHPFFEGRWDVLPLLIAYHIVSINYLDVVTNEEAELFGATLLGMPPDEYYTRICELADSVPGAPMHDPALVAKFEQATTSAAAGGCGSGSCGCGGA